MLFNFELPSNLSGLLSTLDHELASLDPSLLSTGHATGASGAPQVGQELLLNMADNLVAVGAAKGGGPGFGGGPGSSGSPHGPSTPSAPAPTVVGSSGGLQFDLVWDSSVSSAPSGFESAVIAAAQYYTTLYSNKELVTIHVGYGEVNGSSMGSNALGESESYGYLVSYQTLLAALQKDASSSPDQAAADATLPSTDPTHGGQFFITSADAKALGLASASSTSIDGYIGLSSAYPMDYATNVAGNQIAANQYDAFGTAAHEISEVMGRIGSLGKEIGNNVYTPLDLFRYSSAGVRDLTPATGYFSINGGTTNLATYNNPQNGGDAGDWAAGIIGDSYGYGYAGHKEVVSSVDIIENAVLGYRLTPAGVAATGTLNVA